MSPKVSTCPQFTETCIANFISGDWVLFEYFTNCVPLHLHQDISKACMLQCTFSTFQAPFYFRRA